MKLKDTYEHCNTCANKGEIDLNTGEYFCSSCVFQYVFRSDNYKRATTNKMTLLAYVDSNSGSLFWRKNEVMIDEQSYFKRVPALDYEIEFEE